MDGNVAPGSPPPVAPARSGLAIASLVLGTLAVCLSFILLGGLLGLVGLALALVHIGRKRGRNGMAWWGFGLSLLGVLAAIGFGALYYHGFKYVRQAMEEAETGTDLTEWEGVLAPDLKVTTLDGKKIALSELKGKRVVLDFWATWCPPCVKEIPHFIELFNQTSRDDLVILGISSEDEKTLKPFVKQKRIPYPIVSAEDLPPPYSDVQSIPTTFFIDRRGIVQSVLVGYHDRDTLKARATQSDVQGDPKVVPVNAKTELKESERPLRPVVGWSARVAGAAALCAGDWDKDGTPEILVADDSPGLRVFSLDGSEKTSLPLPERFSLIELGHHKKLGPRLLGYSNWGHQVTVIDKTGKQLWTYTTSSGVDGAHWGDLDGDGTDEMIVGMNGGGGLLAVSADGKLLWKDSHIGNVWNQAVIPARAGQAALVFATEAGGTVKVFDSQGKLLRSLRPNGKYCAQMSAAITDSDGSVQVIAIGKGMTIAFDPAGSVAWSTTAIIDNSGWRNISFASGDLTGDGILEWAFLEASGDLVIATPAGERISAIPAQKGVDSFVIAPALKGHGVLATLQSGLLQTYTFE